MDRKVFLSSNALSDLERIVVYIARVDVRAAERMGNQQRVDTVTRLQRRAKAGKTGEGNI